MVDRIERKFCSWLVSVTQDVSLPADCFTLGNNRHTNFIYNIYLQVR